MKTTRRSLNAREYLFPTSAELDARDHRLAVLATAEAYMAMPAEQVFAIREVLMALEAFGASLRAEPTAQVRMLALAGVGS